MSKARLVSNALIAWLQPFSAHLLVPAGLHDAGRAEGVIAVALVDLHLQGRLGMSGVDADDGETALLQLAP
jgi:hypothetical protein